MENSTAFNISEEMSYPTPYATSPLLPLLLLSLTSQQKHSPTTSSEFDEEYDFIIVGAGSAGSVLANRLTELSCVSVLLLEAGKPPPVLTEIPAIARSFVNSDIDWKFYTVPQKYTGFAHSGKILTWPSGKTLGGSSSINAMLYIRGNRRNYDEWAALGAKGWSYKDVLPYFKKLENYTDPEYLNNGYHGSDGPITVALPTDNPPVKLLTMEAVRHENYKFVDPNAKEQIGFYDYSATQRDGQRCGTAKAYLVPSEDRANLDILTGAMVRKVLIEGNRAVGVEFDFDGSTRTVIAKREVILSAGTTNTAQLLMLSGIGPMSELMKHSIPLVQDLPVGLNFFDHPETFLIYEVNSTLRRFNDEVAQDDNIQDYIDFRRGPLTSSEGIQLMSFLRNSDSTKRYIPDHTIYFVDFVNIILTQLNIKPEIVQQLATAAEDKTLLTCAVQLLRPKSHGTVSLESADPYDPPVIDPNYYEDFRDIEAMVEGMKTCQKIMSNPVMQKIGAKPLDFVMPGCEAFVQDMDLYFRCIVRSLLFTTNHQVGTAKMGHPKDPTTVVDSKLRVKGVKGLRCVDASIMPTIPWSNTNIPTIMVAEKASDIIKRTIKC